MYVEHIPPHYMYMYYKTDGLTEAQHLHTHVAQCTYCRHTSLVRKNQTKPTDNLQSFGVHHSNVIANAIQEDRSVSAHRVPISAARIPVIYSTSQYIQS